MATILIPFADDARGDINMLLGGVIGILEDQGERSTLKRPDYAMTLEQIGAELGITAERVRQIELSALSKLRGKSRREILEVFS